MAPPTSVYVSYLASLLLFAVAWLSVGYAVARGAAARGSSVPRIWGLLSVLFLPVGVYYLAWYSRRHARHRPPTRAERIAWVFALSSVVATSLGAIVAPPDPLSQGASAVAAFALVFPAAYYLVVSRSTSQKGDAQ